MKEKTSILVAVIITTVLGVFGTACKTEGGFDSIRVEDMRFHMQFLSSDEFRGRNTPSPELKIASRYIALVAEEIGLKSLMPGGSFFQPIPLDVTTVSEKRSFLTLTGYSGQRSFSFPRDFRVRGWNITTGQASGEVVFLGFGLHAPELDWDDYASVDLKGRIAVILDAPLPPGHRLKPGENRRLLRGRSRFARQQGAAAVLTIIDSARENDLTQKDLRFDNPERGRMETTDPGSSPVPSSPLYQIDIRHRTARAILGISQDELDSMFDDIGRGRQAKQVRSRNLPDKTVEIVIYLDRYKGMTHNVVAYIEGEDPDLKGEYVLFGSHHDGIGSREGRIFNGADDNISGVVAMFELGEALLIERPRRSVIFVWHTGEEKGLNGAYYFVANSPVPVEKISAELNMDMISRNDPNGIYLIGSNKLSSELDGIINAVNKKHIGLDLDYEYEDPGHPDRFFFRSDQYPYIRYGIPGVWFFCGTTEDYHQETDDVELADFTKMERVTKLVYLSALEIANRDGILKLDLDPRITHRGSHNMEINWRQTSAENRNRN